MYEAFVETVIKILPTVLLITICIKIIKALLNAVINTYEVKEEQKESIKKKNGFLKFMSDLYKVFG